MAIVAPMDFLAKDDLYQREKPYRMKFVPPPDLPWTNIKVDVQKQEIQDIREVDKAFSLDSTGFCLMPFKSGMNYEDFENDEKIKETFLPNIARLLESMLESSRIQIFEYLVRRRDVNFPIATKTMLENHQPTTAVHIDMTQEWAGKLARRLNHKKGIHVLPASDYEFINVWMPLKGPVQDWPLALCDVSTVENDELHPGDVVFENFQTENILLEYRKHHCWYYARDQMPDEAWVFRQGDSKGRPCVAHSSFPHPHVPDDAAPRESIEIRALVFT